jgi:hypothetical protein
MPVSQFFLFCEVVSLDLYSQCPLAELLSVSCFFFFHHNFSQAQWLNQSCTLYAITTTKIDLNMSSQQLQWFTKLRFHQQNLQSGDLQLCLLVSTPEISTINPQLCLFFPPNCQNPTKSHGISMKYTFNHHKNHVVPLNFNF